MNAPWFSVATYFKGLAEIKGSTDNPKILEMFRISGHPGVQDDETPWCAAFVGACLRLSGYRGTGSLGARSYQALGKDLGMSPIRGCIVVLSRGGPNASTGHVGFFDRQDDSHIFLLGGNQSDAVSVQGYAKDRLIAYRWPVETAPLPTDTTLPTILQIDPESAPDHVLTGAARGGGVVELPRGAAVVDPDVRAVQAQLSTLGYDPGPLDGELGPLTRMAIEAFQRDHGLPLTGTADVATRRALGLLPAVVQPTQMLPLPSPGTGVAAPGAIVEDVRTVLEALRKAADVGAAANSQQTLNAIIAALAGRTTAAPPATDAGKPADVPDTAVLSPIDKLFGGEALAGKKTLLAVIAYVILQILQVTGTMTPTTAPGGATASTLTTLVTAFGGLGVLSKFDRVVQILGLLAKRQSTG